MLKRFGMFAVTGVLALTVLAACGSEDEEVEPTVTRVPAENAPQVTATAAEAEEEEAAASPVAGSPTAGSPVASPVASESASPVAEVTTTTEAATSVASPVASPQSSAEVSAPEVDMVDINFDPKEITIAANTDVTINLKNSGAATHNFNVESEGIHSGDYVGGQTGTIVVNLPPGEYEYQCDVPGHKEAGMVGTLIVQ
jgi:uncharacterized cupredoxin-like copper-binding protein